MSAARRRAGAAVVLGAALLLGAACGGSGGTGAAGKDLTGSGSAGAVAVGTSAVAAPTTLSFRGRTLDGAPFDAATLAGRPTVLWFWAPWCATCAGQAASVSDIAAQYGDRLGVLGVAGLGDNAAMHEFVADLDVDSVPHLDDQAGEVWRRFGVVEQSSYVLIDRAGTVTHTGWLDDLDFTAKVQTLVG